VDENLYVQVCIHGFPSFDDTYLFCCQVYF